MTAQDEGVASGTSQYPNEHAILISLTHHGNQHDFHFNPDATITELSDVIQDELHIPTGNQKLLVTKLGLLKPPFADPSLPLTQLQDKKINLMGTSNAEIASMNSASKAATARAEHLASARRNLPKAYSRRDPKRAQEDSTYTFMAMRPLPNLPNPQRSLAFLERLKNDPGIRAAMRTHKFSVGLLTEMDPLTYTESNHEGTSRILGLNRNKGEVIELRLRTDAYDGYRDYKTIRKTLCHELAHNVHGPHDRQFWDLCHQIEREVAKGDWKSGGHSVGESDYYEPVESEEIAYDHGGWTGGEFVLGGGGGQSSTSSTANTLSRREVIANAAEQRVKRISDAKRNRKGPDGGDSPSTSS